MYPAKTPMHPAKTKIKLLNFNNEQERRTELLKRTEDWEDRTERERGSGCQNEHQGGGCQKDEHPYPGGRCQNEHQGGGCQNDEHPYPRGGCQNEHQGGGCQNDEHPYPTHRIGGSQSGVVGRRISDLSENPCRVGRSNHGSTPDDVITLSVTAEAFPSAVGHVSCRSGRGVCIPTGYEWLDCHHCVHLLDGSGGRCHTGGGTCQRIDACNDTGPCIPGKRRRPTQADDGLGGGAACTVACHASASGDSMHACRFSSRPTCWRCPSTSSQQDTRPCGSYRSSVYQRENHPKTSAIYTSHPQVTPSGTEAARLVSPVNSERNAFHRCRRDSAEHSVSDKENPRGLIHTVHTPGRSTTHGELRSSFGNDAPPFTPRINRDAHEVFKLGSKLFSTSTRTVRIDFAKWPLHAKRVNPMKEQQILQQMQKSPRSYQAYRTCREYFEPLFLRTVKSTGESEAHLSLEDVSALLNSKLIEETIPPGFQTPRLRIFTVPEPAKRRRRLICHTCDINNATEHVTIPVSFTPIENIIHFLVDTEPEFFCWSNDATAYYHQFPLDEASRIFYTFAVETDSCKKWYRLTTIPTGQRQAVALAQTLSEFLAQEACTQFNSIDTRNEHRTDVYIDNFLGCAPTYEKALMQAHYFCEIASRYGVTLNEKPQASKEVRHRGVQFTYGHPQTASPRIAQVSENMKNKLLYCQNILRDDAITMETTEAIFGICQYASSIIGDDEKVDQYYIYKFMRRRGQTESHATANIWPSIIEGWAEWADFLRSAIRQRRTLHRPYLVVTDASDTGWGGYVFSPFGKPRVFFNTWDQNDRLLHISIKEAKALSYVLISAGIPQGATLKLWLDNTTVLYGIAAKRSRNFRINSTLRTILRQYHILETTYISSKVNPADPLSRENL